MMEEEEEEEEEEGVVEVEEEGWVVEVEGGVWLESPEEQERWVEGECVWRGGGEREGWVGKAGRQKRLRGLPGYHSQVLLL